MQIQETIHFSPEDLAGLDGIGLMKTPISYYGGKQTMLKYLLELIPVHTIYCEPFFNHTTGIYFSLGNKIFQSL